jgi:hypothetical protein
MYVSFGMSLSISLLGALAGPGPSWPSPAHQAGVAWVTDLNAALAEARTGGKLVLVCFNMDGEAANERALAMYRSPQFAKAAADVLCVMCSADEHGGDPGSCSRFGGCSCSAHVASEKQARRHFFGGLRENVAPQHILLYPDGLVAWHAVYEVEPAELFRAIDGANKFKGQALAQRARSQRSQLDSLRGRAAKGVTGAYLQVQAILVQTPAELFLDALQVLDKNLGEKVLADLATYPVAQALPRVKAAQKHITKSVRDLAVKLTAQVESTMQVPTAVAAAPGVETKLLTAPLPVIGPGHELHRVTWVGGDRTLADQRSRITLMWYFLLNAPDLEAQVAEMNEFARAHADSGVSVLGLACDLRPTDAAERLAALRCEFPVGAYAAAAAVCGVERFPSWVVLDPETNIVHRSPQDGSSFEWMAARHVARQMAASPLYRARLVSGN